MNSHIIHLSYVLPENKHTLQMLATENPEWGVEKIAAKTGISSRFISAPDEYSLELGEKAAKKLISESSIDPSIIDCVIFCTQTPKYLIPTSACIIQDRLGLAKDISAFDINLGCSGYIYALSLAQGFIVSQQFRNILIITADTYTKLIDKKNKQLRTIFGDGASVTLIQSLEKPGGLQKFCFYTDGSGADKLISPNSGVLGLSSGNLYCPDLQMDGPDIFNFTLHCVPGLIDKTLEKNNLKKADIDYCIFHQANRYMLEHLRDKIGFTKEQFIVDLENTGNTVSSTIPIALNHQFLQGRFKPGNNILLVGFGVGLSCAATILKI